MQTTTVNPWELWEAAYMEHHMISDSSIIVFTDCELDGSMMKASILWSERNEKPVKSARFASLDDGKTWVCYKRNSPDTSTMHEAFLVLLNDGFYSDHIGCGQVIMTPNAENIFKCVAIKP